MENKNFPVTEYVYGAYKMTPKYYYYYKDGTYKEYVKFFKTELDCARYCVEHDYKYDNIYLEPDSQKSSSLIYRG